MRDSVNNDTNVDAGLSSTRPARAASQSGGLPVRAAAAAAKSALLDLAATNLGVAKASLTVEQGRRLAAAARPSPTARCSATSCSTSRSATRVQRSPPGAPGDEGRSPTTSSSATHGIPRVDIPAKVTGTFTYVAQHPRAGDAPRPRRPAARPGRVRRRHRAEGALDRRELDQEHRRRARSCASATSSASSLRQEYAAIQAAAQLKVKWADMPTIAAVGNVFKQMRDHDSAGKAPARIAASVGNFDSAFANAADQGLAELQVPLQGLDADRPVLCRSPT